ncbi:MAG: DUF2269 family protein [Propionibacteriaceae bacterium]|nr:DUF2269 family protein [Propionibacteriaceae bacterium]
MLKLSVKTMKVLKVVHLAGVSVWVSGVIATLIIMLAVFQQTSQAGILALLSLAVLADYLLIMPGATICYLLGTAYGFFTHWGFLKHKWIICKWILYSLACIPAMLFALPIVTAIQDFVIENQVTSAAVLGLHDKLVLLTALSSSILVIAVVIVVISVQKPFRKKQNTKP